MARILQLRQKLQAIKKGSDSISDLVMKIKTVEDALMAASESVSKRDLLLSLVNGVGHKYDAVIVLISSQHQVMDLEEAQFLFLMHEQRIKQLNITSQINVHAIHFASNNNSGFNSSKSRGNGSNNYRGGNGNRGKGNKGGGRYPCKSNQRIHCQLCAKPGHGALQCYRHFDQQF
ncbi:hypothetical protein ACOSP7_004721 [Xanthoceras sorbifolium]